MGAFKEQLIEIEDANYMQSAIEFLKTNEALSEFLQNEGFQLKDIISISESYARTKVKGHSDIISRFKVIDITLNGNVRLKIETDHGYSFFRSKLSE